jgi:tyrosine-protein kinase Etk/Wzc
MQESNRSDQQPPVFEEEEGIDLLALFGVLWDRKIFILLITGLFALVALLYAIFATPIYKATAMIQVEESAPNMPGFDDMAGMFEETSKSVTEIELLKSRRVIGEAVDSLQLDIIADPALFPIIGGRAYRAHQVSLDGTLASAKLGAIRYAWGGESIEVFRLELPTYLLGKELTLRVEDNQQLILLYKKNILLKGTVGEDLHANNISLSVRSLTARPGTEFKLQRNNRFTTIINLQQEIGASEKGKDSGIINLSYNHKNPDLAKAVLNQVAEIYVRQNVERNSAEAQKSLDFLKVQLPEVKKQLEQAEQKFNDYQIRQQSVNISLETQGVLEQLVELETKLQELELSRLEMSRRFKREHPLYQGVMEQIELVADQKEDLSRRVTDLPETQQELLRYTRDVEVSSEIYIMLLGKVQELDIVRAGTVGNVRIIDRAAVNLSEPVKPRKAMVVVLVTLLGFGLASAFVLIKRALNRGLEDPAELEAIGIPVYATIPESENLLNKKTSSKQSKKTESDLLAVDHPTDLTVEAFRSLRTSLHFAMLGAKNNVITISGPSPGIGKSFVSTNLGAVIAQGGKRVLIIDGDMRRGDLQEHLGMHFDVGLTGYLSGQYQLDEVIRTTLVDGMDILPRGIIAPNPAELLMHQRFSEVVSYASDKYDLVIIDTPPILAVTDPAIIANHAGTTLIVARFGITHKKEIEITQKRFEQNGVEVKGIVFNFISKSSTKYYGNASYYNYDYSSKKS